MDQSETEAASDPAVGESQANPKAVFPEDEMTEVALEIKEWLRVDLSGISIGNDSTVVRQLPVRLDMAAVQYCFRVRFGNPVQEEKTYDHVVDANGRPWIGILRHAQRVDRHAFEFRSADVPFVLREDVLNKKGEVIASAGDVLGYAIPKGGWKPFHEFLRKLQRQGFDKYSDVFDLRIVRKRLKDGKDEVGIVLCKDHKLVPVQNDAVDREAPAD